MSHIPSPNVIILNQLNKPPPPFENPQANIWDFIVYIMYLHVVRIQEMLFEGMDSLWSYGTDRVSRRWEDVLKLE